MGSQAPALTPSPCCVTLLPPSFSHHLLSEPESGEMRATEPPSPTPTVLLQRLTALQTPPTLLPPMLPTLASTSPPSSSPFSPSSASSSSSPPTCPSPPSGGRERPSRAPE